MDTNPKESNPVRNGGILCLGYQMDRRRGNRALSHTEISFSYKGWRALIVRAGDSKPGGAILPVNIFICQTDPHTGACFLPPDSSITTTILSNETPTFGLFVTAAGCIEKGRVFLLFVVNSFVTAA